MVNIRGTKADILKNLKDKVYTASIPNSFVITRKEWSNESSKQQFIKILPKSIPLIVRSSSKWEDTEISTNAGAYLSVPNVQLDEIDVAILNVFKSYDEHLSDDQVLIQEMITNQIISGVAFSHDPNTGSPYKIINWQKGEDSFFVTGGQGGETWHQASNCNKKFIPNNLLPVVNLMEELEAIYVNIPLDIEFIISKNKNKLDLWLLQVRKLIISKNLESIKNQTRRLKIIEEQFFKRSKPDPFLLGGKTVYGIMPDWNPAEIIGIRPRPLASSLYKELITNNIWAEQRFRYGYRDVRGFPLMKTFFGMPYIDIRLSFNSFIPRDLNEQLAEKLVDFYLEKLIKNPNLHDKVEFEVVLSCHAFNMENRIKELLDKGFSKNECNLISSSLKNLTQKIIDQKNGLWSKDLDSISELERKRNIVKNSDLSHFEKIYYLVSVTKKYGTLPFAGLARTAFITVELLKSLIDIGVFSKIDYDQFISSINTVSYSLAADTLKLNKKEFLEKYGHLRPGTYDILSPRYDQAPDLYFDWNTKGKKSNQRNCSNLQFSENTLKKIDKVLDNNNYYMNSKEFLSFAKKTIEYRELSKFIFTKNLSDILLLIEEIGTNNNFSKEELSFTNINTFLELHLNSLDTAKHIKESIKIGRDIYKESSYLSLPPLLIKESDIWGYKIAETSPNFITQNKIVAPVLNLMESNQEIDQKIICIPFADPGFDWLFAKNIVGLITCYGGSNSHMAIRAGEIGLPAIIGCGELKFKKWSNANLLKIDCSNEEVIVIS